MAAKKKQVDVLLVPHPAQGHVFPMLKLAQKLTDHGISVTVVNFDFVHLKIVPEEQSNGGSGIKLVSVPNGFGSDFNDSNPTMITDCVEKVLPVHLRKLLIDEHQQEFSWVIADAFLSAAFVVAKEKGIRTTAFWTASMENLASILRIPQLIQDGTIDENGSLINEDLPISLCREIPSWKANELPWSCQPDEIQSFMFRRYYVNPAKYFALFDCFIVNSFHELEHSAFQLYPNILPIGPLVTNSTSIGSFWRQDPTCLTWLDKHPRRSVIYVAFGSISALNPRQFQELAMGLEMTGKPFLWVIRAGFVKGVLGSSESDVEFPDGFLERVANRGKIVKWSNQAEVLSHPSVACFVSHCGWNSTLDGLWSGVPFLCWPNFTDQFHNTESICKTWKVGMKLKVEGDTGLITMLEIASKVGEMFDDESIRDNANGLMGMATESVNEGGSSFCNFQKFINKLCS
uniref:anthocyanidin 3-O-glucosyltransferase n=1 Tax=Linum usitatissimum TaxID=4006 RepID=I2BH85_LINUS|nr:UDP-glycosyltransferase 1 [Linum usitatissimum]